MGLLFSRLWNRFTSGKERRILMIGLDGAGKTTILYKLKLGQVIHTIPTIGFNVETVKYKKIEFNIFDVGGQEKIRPLWNYYFINTDAVIFVIDSTDIERMDDKTHCTYNANYELHRVIESDDLKNALLLIYANKQDLPNALPISEISKKLGLLRLKTHQWYIQGTDAINGTGLFEGLEWLIKEFDKRKD